MALSLRAALESIGGIGDEPVALRGSFGGRTPRSVRRAIEGMSDPLVGAWITIGKALWSENTEFAHNAQGISSDADHWYVSSNGNRAIGIYKGGKRVGSITPSGPVMAQILLHADEDLHFGALDVHDGWAFVPIQHPHGVWRTRVDGSDQSFLTPNEMPDGDMFPWCAIHPVTGHLYTSSYDTPRFLRAYDPETLEYRSEGKIELKKTSIFLDRVQGATFTERGRLIIVRCDYNAIFCYSALNGHCFGAKALGDYDSSFSEVEDVAVRSWQLNGVPTPVHVLELDNDAGPDDFYVHSYVLPHPELL